tara:strand:- start:3069 stop:4199 length:1131 start_codon:yes stop_codon:yes gene_type:complete
MKLKLKNTPEQVELIRALGSKDQNVAAEASTAFAAFIGPVIQEVIKQASTASLIYTDSNYDEDDSPSYPLDLYYDQNVGYVTTWSQSIAGGMPTSQVEGVKEMKISTYRLDSAVSFMKKYARKSRLDVISKALERMAQEVLVKQERNAWSVLLKALSEAESNVSTAQGNGHILASMTNEKFVVHDLNRMLTLMRRLSGSFASGTPAGADSYGLTDLFVSPEVKQQIRAFAYNPMNTTGSGVLGLPDNVREDMYRSAGASEIYGVRITDLIELGDGKKYTKLLQGLSSLDSVAHNGSTTTGAQGGSMSASTDDLIIGVDATREAFIRPVAQQHDSGGTFVTLPDDQFVARADKTGFYGFLEEGRVCIDARAIIGMIV